MPNWFQVGGNTGNAGNPFGAAIYGEQPAAPAIEETSPQVEEGLYSFPDVTPVTPRESYWADPLNVANVYNMVQTNPTLRNDATFDWDTFNSIATRLADKNKGRQYYEWQGFTQDDPEYALAQSLAIPSFIKQSPEYSGKYDDTGLRKQEIYTPDIELTAPDVTKQSQMSPLEQGVVNALPTVGKTLATVGMGAQGGAVLGLPGWIAGGGLGYGMANADPESAKWYDRVFTAANQALNWGSENVEGLIGYAAAAKEDRPEEMLWQMITGTAEEREEAKQRWSTGIAAGQTFYSAALSQGAVSVPGKIASLVSTKTQLEGDTFGQALTESLQESWERRQEIWGYQGAQGWQPPKDTGAISAAFEDARAMIEQGKAPRDAVDEVNARFGVGGLAADIVGQAILDPLNLVGVGLLKTAGVLGKASKVVRAIEAGSEGGRILGKVLSKMTGGLSDDLASPAFEKAMVESRDVLDLARNYGHEVRAQGATEAAKMGWVSRQLAGVDAQGTYKRFMPPGSTENMTTFERLGNSLIYGTREARAAEMLHHIRQGLAIDLAELDNADDVVRMVDQLASMSPSDAVRASETGKLSGWVDNVMSQSAPAAVRETAPRVRALADAFNGSRSQATAITGLADQLGVNPRKFVNDIATKTDDEMQAYWSFIRSKTGDAQLPFKDGADLRRQAQLFAPSKTATGGMALTLDEFKAHAMRALDSGIGDFTVKYFGVKPQGWGWQIFNTIKKMQGLLLLGLNPAYFLNNGINNVITLAYDGLFSIRSLFGADNFLARWGAPVYKGAQGQALEAVTGAGDEAIRAALRPAGKIGRIQRPFDAANRSKVAFATAVSNRIEQASSKVAMVTALRDTWSRIWRPGIGFDDLPTQLADGLDAVQPGMANKVRNAIKNGMSRVEIESMIFDDLDKLTLADLLDDDGLNMVQQVPGLAEHLNGKLATAKTAQDVSDAFGSARKLMNDWLEETTVEAAQEWAEHAAAVARAEGAHSVLFMLDEMADGRKDIQIEHFEHMDDVAERAAAAPDRHLRGQIWSQGRGESQSRWRQQRNMEKAKMVGVARGLGASTEQTQRLVSAMDDMSTVWDEFYTQADEMYRAHADADYVSVEREHEAFMRMQNKLNRMYEAAHRKEVKAQSAADDAFADMFEAQFPGSRQQAVNWRKQVADARQMQHDAIAYFRGYGTGEALPADIKAKINNILGADGDLNEMSAEVRQTVWRQFLSEVYEPMIIERSVQARQTHQQMLMNAGKPKAISPEEMDAVRVARAQNRQAAAEADEMDAEIADLEQFMASWPERAANIQAQGGDPGSLMDSVGEAEARLAQLKQERQAKFPTPPEPLTTPATPEQRRALVWNTLRQEPEYRDNEQHMVRSASKYLGRKITKLDDITPEEAVLVLQRRAAAKQLNMKGRDIAKRLKAIEDELDMQVADEGGEAVAAVAPVGAVDRMSPLPPYREAVMQGSRDIMRSFDIAEARAGQAPRGMYTGAMKRAPEEIRGGLKRHLDTVYQQLAESKATATRVAEGRRDFALLDYNDRYGFDNYLSAVMPYQFWYTRSMKNWALRVLTRPEILHRYTLIMNAGRNTPQEDLPKRMQGKFKVPIPFMPEEFGDGVYVDFARQGFPFVQIWKAMTQYDEDQNMLQQRTLAILQGKVQEGEMTAQQMAAALQDRSSDLWLQAEAEAKTEIDMDIRNPADFISAMSGFSLPLQWIYQGYVMRSPERISSLPITKTLQNLSYVLGRPLGLTKGVDVEAPIRKGLGLPASDRYSDIYINRALAAMASDAQANGGKIKGLDGKELVVTPDDFRRTLIDRSGPLFDLAQKRVSDMALGKWIGSPVGMDFLQQGEERQRALKNEYGMMLGSSDPDAYRKFQDTFPEYKVQQAAWQPDEKRLRTYLKDMIWNTYYELPEAQQDEFAKQMGDEFVLLFKNKDTRNYDAIPTETMSMWVKTMGQTPPAAAGNIPAASIKWADPVEAAALSQFREMEMSQFPGLKKLLSSLGYYDKTPEEQDKLALANPEIMVYNRWRDAYLANHPEVINRVISPKNVVYGKSIETQAAYYKKKALRAQMFPGIEKTQDAYFSFPEKSQERKQFLIQHPELRQYWDWNEQYDKQNLPLSLAWKSESQILKAFGMSPQKYDPRKVLDEMSDELSGRMVDYLVRGVPLSGGALSELDRLRSKFAKGESRDQFLSSLRVALLPQQY